MSGLFDMNGYGGYVWPAYGIAMAGLALNIWLARRQLRQARDQVRRRLAMEENA
jgi:heme exporter protein CcmD